MQISSKLQSAAVHPTVTSVFLSCTRSLQSEIKTERATERKPHSLCENVRFHSEPPADGPTPAKTGSVLAYVTDSE